MAFLTFSTEQFAPREQLEAAQDLYRAIANVDLDIARGETPRIAARFRLLPGVSVAFIECSALVAQRGRAQVCDGNDDLSLLINPFGRDGWTAAQQGLPEFACGAGAGCLGLNDRLGRVAFHGRRARFLSVAFSRTLLAPLVADLDAAARRGFSNVEALRLLTRQALDLVERPENLPAQAAPEAADRLLDLAAVTLGAAPDAERRATQGGLRRARLRAIKADLVALSAQGDIALADVAARHGVSPGYVRALFREEGTSFTDYLLDQRLLRAFRRLSNPANAALSVGAVAYDCGFNNLSWFYRAFRRRFGMTPGEAKEVPAAPVGQASPWLREAGAKRIA